MRLNPRFDLVMRRHLAGDVKGQIRLSDVGPVRGSARAAAASQSVNAQDVVAPVGVVPAHGGLVQDHGAGRARLFDSRGGGDALIALFEIRDL